MPWLVDVGLSFEEESRARVGAGGVTASLQALHDEQSKLPDHARSALHGIAAQLRALSSEIDRLETQILAWHRNDETSCRLATIPGIGPITASAIAAAVPDAPTGLERDDSKTDTTKVSFTWTAPADNGGAPITEYIVYLV